MRKSRPAHVIAENRRITNIVKSISQDKESFNLKIRKRRQMRDARIGSEMLYEVPSAIYEQINARIWTAVCPPRRLLRKLERLK